MAYYYYCMHLVTLHKLLEKKTNRGNGIRCYRRLSDIPGSRQICGHERVQCSTK